MVLCGIGIKAPCHTLLFVIRFKGVQKRKFDPTMGLKIGVITHLSDDEPQTLCKILYE